MKAIIEYFSQVKLELSQVIWPKRKEVVKLTTIVIVIVFIVGIFIGSVDYLLTKLLEIVLTG